MDSDEFPRQFGNHGEVGLCVGELDLAKDTEKNVNARNIAGSDVFRH